MEAVSCRHLEGKVGDKGQRFEIRYNHITHVEPTPGVFVESARSEKVLGWSNDYVGAWTMLAAFQSAPYCDGGRIIDRKALTVRKLIAELQKLPESDMDQLVALESVDDEPGGQFPWNNATSVGRMPDGRILID